MPEEELVAIILYTSTHFVEWNKTLREKRSGDDGLQDHGAGIALADKGLSKMPVYQGTVHRGTSLPREVLDRYVPGQVVTEDAFTSSSTQTSGTDNFQGNVQFVIESKTGRSIDSLSRYDNEKEVLFRPGTQFVVTDKEHDGDRIIIRMREVDAAAAPGGAGRPGAPAAPGGPGGTRIGDAETEHSRPQHAGPSPGATLTLDASAIRNTEPLSDARTLLPTVAEAVTGGRVTPFADVEEAVVVTMPPPDGGSFSIRVTSGPVSGGGIAHTFHNPSKTGRSNVRTSEGVRASVDVHGRYVIVLSDALESEEIERALAQQVAAVVAERELSKENAAPGPDALGTAALSADARLSPTDHGRVAELNVLATQISRPDFDRAHVEREILVLLDTTGLREGVLDSESRLALVEPHLTPSARTLVHELRRASLDPERASLRRTIDEPSRDETAARTGDQPLHQMPRATSDRRVLSPDEARLLADTATAARAARSRATVARYRALQESGDPLTLDGPPMIGGGASLAARVPEQLLVDARQRWQADASSHLAQTAHQLRDLEQAGIGVPYEFARPNDRVPLEAVRYWEDSIAAQGDVIDGTATLSLHDGKLLLTVQPSEGGPPLVFTISGVPSIATGFVPERVPGTYNWPPDRAIAVVREALEQLSSDPALGEAAMTALARIRPSASAAAAEAAALFDTLDARLRTQIGAVSGDAASALASLAAAREWTSARSDDAVDGVPQHVFFGDEANHERMKQQSRNANEWVFAGSGGTSISAAEIILANNPSARVTMVGAESPAGLIENTQFRQVAEEHADAATAALLGLEQRDWTGRLIVITGQRLGPLSRDGHRYQLVGPDGEPLYRGSDDERVPVEGDAYVASMGREMQLPPVLADLYEQTIGSVQHGERGRVSVSVLVDDEGFYVGYRVAFDVPGQATAYADVTGAASRYLPVHLVDPAERDEARRIFSRSDQRDAPPESGNFAGGYVATATQAARYARHRGGEHR